MHMRNNKYYTANGLRISIYYTYFAQHPLGTASAWSCGTSTLEGREPPLKGEAGAHPAFALGLNELVATIVPPFGHRPLGCFRLGSTICRHHSTGS